MLTWPQGLPYGTQRDNYRMQNLGLPPLQSQMQSGKTRMRKQFTLRISTMQVSIILTPAQLGVFHQFMRDTGELTAEFTMPVWVASAQVYQPRTVQVKGGASGVTEDGFALDKTRISMLLDVRNL